MRAFDVWFAENHKLLQEAGVQKVLAERIYEAGRLEERESILELISDGVLTVHGK